MKTDTFEMSSALRQFAKDHLVLLKPENRERGRDTVQIRLSGYADVMYMISDIVKVSILALANGQNSDHTSIPDPACNVSGVLSIILDLIPLEEANLLDQLRRAAHNPTAAQPTQEDWEFALRSVSLLSPSNLKI